MRELYTPLWGGGEGEKGEETAHTPTPAHLQSPCVWGQHPLAGLSNASPIRAVLLIRTDGSDVAGAPADHAVRSEGRLMHPALVLGQPEHFDRGHVEDKRECRLLLWLGRCRRRHLCSCGGRFSRRGCRGRRGVAGLRVQDGLAKEARDVGARRAIDDGHKLRGRRGGGEGEQSRCGIRRRREWRNVWADVPAERCTRWVCRPLCIRFLSLPPLAHYIREQKQQSKRICRKPWLGHPFGLHFAHLHAYAPA